MENRWNRIYRICKITSIYFSSTFSILFSSSSKLHMDKQILYVSKWDDFYLSLFFSIFQIISLCANILSFYFIGNTSWFIRIAITGETVVFVNTVSRTGVVSNFPCAKLRSCLFSRIELKINREDNRVAKLKWNPATSFSNAIFRINCNINNAKNNLKFVRGIYCENVDQPVYLLNFTTTSSVSLFWKLSIYINRKNWKHMIYNKCASTSIKNILFFSLLKRWKYRMDAQISFIFFFFFCIIYVTSSFSPFLFFGYK